MPLAERKIIVLPPELCNQIAAGEVVDRPAGVLKELAENSLDAGADDLRVSIEDGGLTYLSVRDNGNGMSPEDLELAVARHATSKLRSFNDLLRISSYGFRGEALPSIASVSNLKITSKPENRNDIEREAYFLELEHGRTVAKGPAALAGGTLVEVRGLFANVPARLKFLKNPATETKRCQDLLTRLALARTDAAFSLDSNGRRLLSFSAGMDLKQRLRAIWPPLVTDALLPFAGERHGVKAYGLAGHPGAAQSRGDRIFLYVNRRPVNDKLLLSALREAYKGRLISREYPQAVLFVDLDPEEVDVNVHPTKSEVRFRDERSVFSAVLHAVQAGLNQAAPAVGEHAERPLPPLHAPADRPARPPGFWGAAETVPIIAPKPAGEDFFPFAEPTADAQNNCPPKLDFLHLTPPGASRSGRLAEAPAGRYGDAPATEKFENVFQPGQGLPFGVEGVTPAPDAEERRAKAARPEADDGGTPVGELAYLGQIADTYLLVRHRDKLLIFDQHAAHERILLHRLEREDGRGLSQLLFLPLDLPLHPGEAEQLQSIRGHLAGLGFIFEGADAERLVVKGLPAGLPGGEALVFLREALAARESGLDELRHMMACRAAIKAGQRLSRDEAAGLLAQWLPAPDREFCPHGRPAVLELAPADLEKMFKRRG